MTIATDSGWTILRTVARFRAPPRGMLFGTLGIPRALEAEMSETEVRVVAEKLTPILAELRRMRREFFDETESGLRMKMTAAAVAGFILGWLLMGSFPTGLLLMVGGAFFAFLMLVPQADDVARARTKHAIIEVMAGELLSLTSIAPGARPAMFSEAVVNGWRLLPLVWDVTVDDLLVGEREGYRVSLSRVGFQFGGSSNVRLAQGEGAVFVVSEIADEGIGRIVDDRITIVVGADAPAMLRSAPQLAHRLAQGVTGDQAFDVRYRVYGDPSPLTPAVREGFTALEVLTRCDGTGTRNVAAGHGLRPAVIIGRDRLVVLTAIPVFDGVLEPPPLWEPLKSENLIPAFASDLLVLNDYLEATIKLHKVLTRTNETTRGFSS